MLSFKQTIVMSYEIVKHWTLRDNGHYIFNINVYQNKFYKIPEVYEFQVNLYLIYCNTFVN